VIVAGDCCVFNEKMIFLLKHNNHPPQSPARKHPFRIGKIGRSVEETWNL